MSEIYLYDSLSNKKKKFEPIDQNHVRIYACGPTVYNYAVHKHKCGRGFDLLAQTFSFC